MPLRNAASLASSALSSNCFRAVGKCGNAVGNFSWNIRSYATINVIGAVIVFSTLAGLRAGRNRSLAWEVVSATNRIGWRFMLVGPLAAIAKALRMSSNGTL